MKIIFNNNNFKLNSDGSIFWQEESCLILGDLHLEKSTSYMNQGNFLPPYDTIETLSNLSNTIQKLNASKLILLGDIFHDNKAYKRLGGKEKKIFDDICNFFEVIWIKGNHDNNFIPKNIKTYNKYKKKNLTFTHISETSNIREVSGHYHPKVSFKYVGVKITKPCFMIDNKRLILPAYGSYTGGLNLKSRILQSLFSNQLKVYAVGNKKVLEIKNKNIL